MKEKLIQFEKDVKQFYLDGKLRSPVHLSGGNEDHLISIFKDIKPNDWVFTNYRSHYHALLKGVPEKRLKDWILDNKSIHFMDKEFKIFSSAIVGGTLSIAMGTAYAIKLQSQREKLEIPMQRQASDGSSEECVDKNEKLSEPSGAHVWCFVGDMTSETGNFMEVTKFARRNNLPITFVVEDNGLSTDTPTQNAWGNQDFGTNILRYKYTRTYPHYGCGVFVDFPEDKEELKQDGTNF